MESNPMVSVVLPVRNGMPYIVEAIQSVLIQSYTDFEILVVNDGSNDGTRVFLDNIGDPRLKIIDTKGIGLVEALNLGLSQCSGRYIARMDADDVCMPSRFVRQVTVLNADPTIGVVCSDITRIDEQGRVVGMEKFLIRDATHLRNGLIGKLKFKPVVHPSVMMRTELLIQVGGYRSYHAAEDHDLWLRLMDYCRFFRISEPLLKYRVTSGGISRMQRDKQSANTLLSIFNYLVNRQTNVDLYKSYPVVWNDFQRIFMDYACRQAPEVLAFEKTKNYIRTRKYINAFILLAINILKSPNYFFPRFRQIKNYRFVEDVMELAYIFLSSVKDLPPDTVAMSMSQKKIRSPRL